MKIKPLLVFTFLLVQCQFATITLGSPTFSESQVKGHVLTESIDKLNARAEAFNKAEEYFQKPGRLTSTLSKWPLLRKNNRRPENDSPLVEFRDPKTLKTRSFISCSIPDLEGKDHVYVVQVAPKLGTGKSGVVYLAKDIKNPDTFVAIKVTESQAELKGLKLVGELLGSMETAGELFLVMPFVPGILLSKLSDMEYNGKPVYEYWMDENNKGYHTLLYRIAHDVVAPLMNKFLIHKDLHDENMMVAQIDENYLPAETDPSTGLQHFCAIDFGDLREILEGENILEDIREVAFRVLRNLEHPIYLETDPKFHEAIEMFQQDVIDALNKNKFDIELENGRPNVSRKKGMVAST